MALAFLGLGTTIDISNSCVSKWLIFIFTTILFLVLGFLAIYDGLYGKLPMLLLIFAIIVASIIMILKICFTLSIANFSSEIILNPICSVAILGGLYLVLYLMSKGKWVGDGDWLLGTAIGLALSSPWLALITLFISNTLACLVMAPIVKKSKNRRIYFGPFMVVAFVITLVFADLFVLA